MGFGSNGIVAEGTPLSKFTDKDSRKKTGGSKYYWMRSPHPSLAYFVRGVNDGQR